MFANRAFGFARVDTIVTHTAFLTAMSSVPVTNDGTVLTVQLHVCELYSVFELSTSQKRQAI